nr:hypothetical protein [Streptomyces sp. BK340]
MPARRITTISVCAANPEAQFLACLLLGRARLLAAFRHVPLDETLGGGLGVEALPPEDLVNLTEELIGVRRNRRVACRGLIPDLGRYILLAGVLLTAVLFPTVHDSVPSLRAESTPVAVEHSHPYETIQDGQLQAPTFPAPDDYWSCPKERGRAALDWITYDESDRVHTKQKLRPVVP